MHVIFGATLIVWVVADEWLQVPGLISYPHTTPDRFLIGGPSNAGALFVDWARTLLRGAPRPGPAREALEPGSGSPDRVPVWLPYVRGERTPFNDHTLRSNLYGLDIASGAEALERAAFEASGFVIRRIIDGAGVAHAPHRRQWRGIHGSPRGWRPWPTPPICPSRRVAVPDGAARGAAYLARMAAGLETSLNDVGALGQRSGAGSSPTRPGSAATESRYRRFCELGTGGPRPSGAQPLGVKATLSAPLWSWPGDRLEGVPPVGRARSGGSAWA